MLIGIATSARKVALRDIKLQDFAFPERPVARNGDNDRFIRDEMGMPVVSFAGLHCSVVNRVRIVISGLPSHVKFLVPAQKNSPAAVYTIHGSCNPTDAAFDGSLEFHVPGLLLAYIHATGRTSGYLFSRSADGSSRPGAQFVTKAVVDIAKTGGIDFSAESGEAPPLSAHSLRRTGTSSA